MVSNLKFIPYFNILQNFVQNVQKTKMALYPELKPLTSGRDLFNEFCGTCNAQYLVIKCVFLNSIHTFQEWKL